MNINLEDIAVFKHLDLLAKRQVEGFITGLHKSPFHGFSVEFAEHRIYNPGESTRHIDWKVFAKTDRLYTKRYEEETNLRCYVLLDASASMFYPQQNHLKIRFSAFASACLFQLFQKQRDAFALATFSQDIQFQSALKSTNSHFNQLVTVLQNTLSKTPAAHQTSTSVSKAIHAISEQIGRRAMVILFSDMFEQEDPEGVFLALRHLKHQKHEVLVFHTIDKSTEFDFAFENRPYEFIDIETQEKLKLHPVQLRAQYQERMKSLMQHVYEKCAQYKIDLIECDVKESVDQVLQAYLVKRKKMLI
jgi:uncharacterized protein (DUF58 family)